MRADANTPGKVNIATIGTGCVVAPHRMITASHVIDNKQATGELAKHKEGDAYYFIKRDDEGTWHYRFFTPALNKELFLYPDIDLAIIYLDDGFYQNGETIYTQKDDYIRIDETFHPIGTDMAVLGYPLCKLDFVNGDINNPNLGNILLRADSGIINCRYHISATTNLYEFTVAFNPGNSGGPIYNWRTGKLISIVHGFRATPTNMNEHILTDEEKTALNLKKYSEESFIDVVHANYSIGYASPSFLEAFKKHNIL
jgi:V8-like Glu-specific endopeptidase